jgi:hypothetical protein
MLALLLMVILGVLLSRDHSPPILTSAALAQAQAAQPLT